MYLSLHQGEILTSEKDGKKTNIVTMYRNCTKDRADLSMDDYFYRHFCREVLDEKGDQ